MKKSPNRSASQQRIRGACWIALIAVSAGLRCASATDLEALLADRAAIERVYHNHRLGEKTSFEQALPRATLEKLVRDELRKEAALRQAYKLEVTPAMVEEEVRRIDSTTRAPEVLGELKAALGNDPARFARAMARPIVVDRLLRARFEGDDQLHSVHRRAMEQVRTALTNAAAAGATAEKLNAMLRQSQPQLFSEAVWQLGSRPEEKAGAPGADELEVRRRFGPNAQILGPQPPAGHERRQYFEELPPELRQVLQVQLRQAGDVSAVIEMPHGFVLYLAREKTAGALAVSCLFLGKRGYEEWLAQFDIGFDPKSGIDNIRPGQISR